VLLSVSGGSEDSKTKVSTCAAITQEEADTSSSLEVTTRLIIRGGTKKQGQNFILGERVSL